MLRKISTITFTLSALVCSACSGQGGSGANDAGSQETGRVQLAVGSNLATSSVTRVTFSIGPGNGTTFAPIIGQLSPAEPGGWSGYLTGIPAGRLRTIDVTGYDLNGTPVLRGGANLDVSPQGITTITVLLQPVSPPSNTVVSTPVVQSLSVSPALVAPGAQAVLSATATATESLAYSWQASCGTLSTPTMPSTLWTAPNVSDGRCEISFTAATADGSTTVSAMVKVQQDVSLRDIAGQRLVNYWLDPPPGYTVPSVLAMPAPDVGVLPAPSAILETAPGSWVTFPGGHTATDGSFVQGTFDSAGSFVIPGVPGGAYVLSFLDASGLRWLVDGNSSAIDLGYDLLGRATTSAPRSFTMLKLTFHGLFAWRQSVAELEASSSSANVWAEVPTAGQILDTNTDAQVLMPWLAPLSLITPTDTLWLHQLTPMSNLSGLTYLGAVRWAALEGLTLVEGGSSSVDVPMSGLFLTGSLPVSWDPTQFEVHLSNMAPASRLLAGVVPAHRVSVLASPYGSTATGPQLAGGSAELARLDLAAGAGPLTLTQPLAYGQFLPSWWKEIREVRYAAAVAYRSPGSTSGIVEVSQLGSRSAMPATSSLNPVVTPPQAFRINGSSALADLAAPVTLTPTLSWTPPLLGAPSFYVLEISQLYAGSDGITVATPVVRYITRSTHVDLPPGSLSAGAVYFARLTAVVTSAALDSAPLRRSAIEAYADALTGTFTP